MPKSRPGKTPAERNTRRATSGAPALPTLQAFIDHGGHIAIGRIRPIECAAIANDETTMYVALQGRRGEPLTQLLDRLDAALRHCLDSDEFIDEINAP